jgi:TPR repeat protein
MSDTALGVARRLQHTAQKARRAVERNPLTSVGTLGVVGAGLWLASSLGSPLGSQTLYTETSGDCSNLLKQASDFDARVDAPESQAHFEELMNAWTKAAGLYAKAGDCDKAQCALARLRYEGRGYVYDPEYGTQLYERAAFAGNKDAVYALACIALRVSADKDSGHDVIVSGFIDGDKRKYLYEAAALLRARGDALTARTDFTLDDPMAWIKKTKGNIEAAAKSSPSANTQFLLIDYENPKLQYATWQYVRANRDRKPDGWRGRVQVLQQLASASPAEFIKRKEAVRALLDDAKSDDDAHQKTSVARVVLRYCEKARDPSMRAEASALLDQAASKGDLGAIMQKWDALRPWSGKNVQLAARSAVLEQGARAGSRQLLYERGLVYEREGKQAKKDFRQAAELGHWDAMMSYRGQGGLGVNTSHNTLLSKRVIVLPIPAALAMELGPATLVLGNGSSSAPGLGMEKDELIQVAWPDLSSLDHDDAIRVLRDAYASVFSSATTKWVILEPIDRARFGAHSQHDLTARAVLGFIADASVMHQKNATPKLSHETRASI